MQVYDNAKPSAGEMRRNENGISMFCFVVGLPFPLMDRDDNNCNYNYTNLWSVFSSPGMAADRRYYVKIRQTRQNN